ncbi:hypothetical protein PybrP1_007305 [[Pythium] brassicae (nom. inval.)]|nr:hypothetical protein PybrP1_007305 [[Pythium] brassicae (nom. inval.)]
MRSFSSTAAALVALLALAAGGADAQSCELPVKTLTYKCSECTANVPCWYNTTTTAATSACKSVCMTGVYDQIKTFSLIVPFGTWKSAQELAEPVPLPASTVNTLASYSFINNNYLDTFDVMDLPATSTKIAISGGTSLGVNVKGHVSNVKLAPTLAANASGVTIVWLLNLNLQPQADDIAQMLPPKIQYLALDNGLLSDFPKGMSSLTSLKALFFRTNYVKSVDSTAGLDGLSELWLSENNIESFTAVFPKLQVLDLALNNLPQFPKVLAKYSALQTLWYYNNSVTEVANDAPLPSSLTTLSLYNNKISSFEAVLPSLTSLDLSNNELTEIPPVVFTFSSLTLLRDGKDFTLQDGTTTNGTNGTATTSLWYDSALLSVADVALLQMIASGQSCPEKIAEIGNRCFALNPSERPAAAEIAYALRQLKKGLYR